MGGSYDRQLLTARRIWGRHHSVSREQWVDSPGSCDPEEAKETEAGGV